MTRPAVTRALAYQAAVICATAGVVYGVATRTLEFGSEAGGWVYPFVQGVTPAAALAAVLLAVSLPAVFERSARHADARAWRVVGVWTLLGAGLQMAIRQLYPIPPGRIVASADCNSFFSATQQHAPLEVITNYAAVTPTLPLHAQANMPGKLFIYYLLELFSRDPASLALAIIALSTIGAVVVFHVARRLFHSGRAATLAMVLSLVFPAMVGFQPLLNTVTPIFALVSFWAWVLYLDRRQDRYLWLAGASVYVQVFVDPLSLAIGVVFLGVLAERLARGELTTALVVRSVTIPVAAFLVFHAIMWRATGFDIVSVGIQLAGAAADFNKAAGRPYGVWLVHNAKEFFLGAGVAPSFAAVLALASSVRLAAAPAPTGQSWRAAVQRFLARPGSAFTASVFLCLLILDLLGVNRGEVSRLWIFLGVFLQLAAAHGLTAHLDGEATAVSIGSLVVQTVLTTSMVGYIVC